MTWHFSIIDWHNNRFQAKALLDFSTRKINCKCLWVFYKLMSHAWGRKVASKTKTKSSQRTWLNCLPVCLFCFSLEPSHEKVFASWRPADLVLRFEQECKWRYLEHQSLNSELGYPRSKSCSTISFWLKGLKAMEGPGGRGGVGGGVTSRLFVPEVFSMY